MTDQQVADVFIKPLDRTKFEKFSEDLGVFKKTRV